VKFGDLATLRAIPSVTAAQMGEVDRLTVEELHVPVDVLMENAGHQIAVTARAFLGGSVAGKRVIGLVGSGNNGGDAAVALRHLVNWGARVCAEVAAPRSVYGKRHVIRPAVFSYPLHGRSRSCTKLGKRDRATSRPTS
jgi:NAD(P)H-hydrate repair Nnr-like enzyme with NAD(P)H-hydrate epimerase domain